MRFRAVSDRRSLECYPQSVVGLWTLNLRTGLARLELKLLCVASLPALPYSPVSVDHSNH